jgi:hypothetical protein
LADWPSVAAAIAEAPYRIPSEFDSSRLQRLVSAKRQEAEDHIWSLREDPGYFQDCVYDWSEHRPEQILDISGKKHPDLGKPIFWERVLDAVVTTAYANLIMWDLAEAELDKVVQLRDSYGSRLSLYKRMPADYGRLLGHFRELVQRMRYAPLMAFQGGISLSPPLRQYYVQKQLPHGPMTIRPLPPEGRRFDYFLWFVEKFCEDAQLQLYGFSDILDEFERLTRSKTIVIGAPQNQLISSWIAVALSELAVITEIERQLDFHQPPIRASTLNEHELEAEFQQRTLLIDRIHQAGRGLSLAGEATPLAKFTYPAGKRRTGHQRYTRCAKQRPIYNTVHVNGITSQNQLSKSLGMLDK